MRLLLPIILAVLGVVGGGYVGLTLKPAPEPKTTEQKSGDASAEKAKEDEVSAAPLSRRPSKATDSSYVALDQKLIVPIRRANGRKAFVALDATLEIDPKKEDWVKAHQPKTVDAFLRVMIAFAATGAFDDHAETAMALDDLNDALLTTAEAVLGDAVRAVLISNLITQDS